MKDQDKHSTEKEPLPGADPEEIQKVAQEILDHKNIGETQIYTHITAAELDKTHKRHKNRPRKPKN